MCACVFCNNCVYVRDSFVMCCVVLCGLLFFCVCVLCFRVCPLSMCVVFVFDCVVLCGVCVCSLCLCA